jgi:LacI family transcriptional regulator
MQENVTADEKGVERLMPTKLKDIARHLNLSVSTVSRVLNGTGRVSKETKELILKTIKELNYQPNEIARSLKRKRANIIGVIVPDISNNFYSAVIKGIEKVASENEHMIIVCNSDENISKEEDYIQILLQKQVAGLIIATVGGNTELFNQYRGSGVPVVFFDNLPLMKENYDVVTIDNKKASYTLTAHFIEQGYDKLAIITGPLRQSSSIERLEGFKKCVEDKGISIDERWIGVGEFKMESGYDIMKSWLEESESPSALLAANNFLAYGAIKAIQEKGLRIPEDIALACFDAKDDTGIIKPQITSINQPAYDIGTIAADIIMRKASNKNLAVYERIILEPSLEINESSVVNCKAIL